MRVGIIFGGDSREREISFAGGRTVYDNLNKSLFEAVPLFVDSFRNFILIDWQYIYKGSIRDFYPPVEFLPASENDFQVYAESLGERNPLQEEKLFSKLGKKVRPDELTDLIDFAFLCLHGPYGEDGKIQGLLESVGLPYSGSGILSSAIGINKVIQKKLMKHAGFPGPAFTSISRREWLISDKNAFEVVKKICGFPCVVKSASQGSSIGVSILHQEDKNSFEAAVDKSFFIRRVSNKEWNAMEKSVMAAYIRNLCDIREGIGIPVRLNAGKKSEIIFHPEILLSRLSDLFEGGTEQVILESLDSESEVLVESFIAGKEFSCIVIRNNDGEPVALPPTEIRKGKELFDYRSKYLPGLSRKITPIHLPEEQIELIRSECERLFKSLAFNVYARIDGFIDNKGNVFLNDPNTTSGMMPSSFFFHQAAEIGLNPSQFLSYIIRTSLLERIDGMKDFVKLPDLLDQLDRNIIELKKEARNRIRVAVIMGGYSSERHISVESGRNIYEKLSSSVKYEAIPVFLSGDSNSYRLIQIPVNLMLKDNADDIREKAENYVNHPVIDRIMNQCQGITSRYTMEANVLHPRELSFADLAEMCDVAFIALHGRPGEDGALQNELEKVGLPYNGSGIDSSQITINKYETNEILKKNGFLVADHTLVNEADWRKDKKELLSRISSRFTFPFIAKPVDDGCSSAVKKIRNEKELDAFAEMIFRKSEDHVPLPAEILQLKPKEEFPMKNEFLIEELISRNNAKRFLEITGGLLTTVNDDGTRNYQAFEASEALSEGDVLSLEEKFLAGEGQNITPARYSTDSDLRNKISEKVKAELVRAAQVLNVEGYARIDAFVRIYDNNKTEVIFIEVNSLPGMTPATCIFHQCAIAGYKPYEFIDAILEYGMQRKKQLQKIA
ncbi:MAG: D-alanine--D-alanine ligase [Bacteroidetes bacterium]|nr:MAG: D-alanine--D-alanine ligase [Bacteroidota bacterium]REK07077.1 MAG: D-alanine--D-alanine ligase [Bacteroidota bacterium]REK33749.1 MAG: D-alanine--D-alanine ligase [Bacteroidota bacterium]